MFQKGMEGVIVNFRVGMKTMYHNHMIVSVKSLKKRADAVKLVGKTVVFTTTAKNQIKGKVASAHGNSGALRVIFEKAMPGQAIGKKVVIE
jgi:ribosomal protein L35AE/L33A